MGAVETVTIGSDTFSVYGLGNADPVADGDTYFNGRLGSSGWTGAVADDKARALVTAARFLDRGLAWSGTKTVAAQAREWPRDSATCDGEAVADGTTPDEIVHGEFELALALLDDAAIQDSANSGSNVKRAKAGSAEVEFFVPTSRPTDGSPRFPQAVHELVSCYSTSSGTATAPFVDGTDSDNADEVSHFTDCTNDFDITQGGL